MSVRVYTVTSEYSTSEALIHLRQSHRIRPVRWCKLTQRPFRRLPSSAAALKVRVHERLHRC